MRLPMLKKRRSFLKARNSESVFFSKHLIMQVLPASSVGESSKKFGITCSSKVGGAVVRNKFKRQLKSLLVLLFHSFSEEYVFVVIVKPGAVGATFSEIKASLETLMRCLSHKGSQ